MSSRCIVINLTLAIVAALVAAEPALALEADGQSLFDVVKKRGMFIAGNRSDFPPMGYIGKGGSNVGIDIELSKYCANKLEVKYEGKQLTSSTRIPMLLSGNVDTIVAVLNPTRERSQVIDFTGPYYQTGLAIMVRKGSAIKTLADLTPPKRVAGVQGSNDMKNFLRLQPTGEVLYFQEHPQAVLAVLNEKADAAITTLETLRAFVDKNPEKLEVIMPPFLPETFVIGVRRDDSKWRLFLEQCIMDATKDGSLAGWVKEHAGREMEWKPNLYVDYY